MPVAPPAQPRRQAPAARSFTLTAALAALSACASGSRAPATPPPVATPTPAAPAATAPPTATRLRAVEQTPPLASLDANRVIPAPASVVAAAGAPFTIGRTTVIVVPASGGEPARVGEMLATLLRPATGYEIPVRRSDDAAPAGAIVLRVATVADAGDEGYELVASPDSLRLAAGTPAGLFHAVQTLRQLLPEGIEADQSELRIASGWSIPAGRIADHPRFAWRGAMLDVARHFFTPDEVRQYVDLLALYKFNTLHLHLADDQGWRIEIESWPKLTTVGGSTEVGARRGGYYTKWEYTELVRYAADRFVTIVPEIDMPAHTNAAIAAYPQLGCSQPTPSTYADSAPRGLYTGIRVGWSTLCPDSAVVLRFVDDVVRELAAMTPGPYLHLGGDEVHALSKEQYSGFVTRVDSIVALHGKTMVGWEEIVSARLHPTTIAQRWQQDSTWFSRRGSTRMIASPVARAYLDMKYSPATELGLRWGGFVDLQSAYDWDPLTQAPGLSETDVVGVEAALWTETIRNLTAAEYLIMPRLPAIAEVAWTAQAARSWPSFRTRVGSHAPRWRLLGINYFAAPEVEWAP